MVVGGYDLGYMTSLAPLHRLRTLRLSQILNESEMFALGKLDSLETLSVRVSPNVGPAIQPRAALMHLSELKQLRSLELEPFLSDDESLGYLQCLPSLTAVYALHVYLLCM